MNEISCINIRSKIPEAVELLRIIGKRLQLVEKPGFTREKQGRGVVEKPVESVHNFLYNPGISCRE